MPKDWTHVASNDLDIHTSKPREKVYKLNKKANKMIRHVKTIGLDDLKKESLDAYAEKKANKERLKELKKTRKPAMA